MTLIKDLPKEERPREKLLLYGKENLTDSELLAIILKTGTKDTNVKELALILLKKMGNLKKIKDLNVFKLKEISGIGETKAITLLATLELGKRIYLKNENEKKEKYLNANDIYKYNKYLFDNLKQEYFYTIYLNNKNEVIDKKLLFMGTINKSIVHPREIFKEAYLLSACSIICMHNHPSGDVTPSKEDIYFTKNLQEIGKLQGIPVIDHIIFGKELYFSFYEEKYI